jgi:anti-sigma factor ChrR (cupin superfamily)
MGHPAEDVLAAVALGLLPRTQGDEIVTHLETCRVCDQSIADYREIAAALHAWHEAPGEAATAGYDAIVQRIRLRRLIDHLFANADLRRQAGEDPQRLLAAHGIAATPELLAAFKDFGLSTPERFPGELDERVTKVLRLLDWFPGGSDPGP